MTFSTDVKQELSAARMGSKIEALLELSAISRTNASIHMNHEGMRLLFFSESRDVIQRVGRLAKLLYGEELPVLTRQNEQLQKKPIFQTYLEGAHVERFLEQGAIDLLGNYTEEKERIFGRLQSEENGRAYLRGAFLGGGSVVDPVKSYHLELVTSNAEDAWLLRRVLEAERINAKHMRRKGNEVIYMKDSEAIAEFLVAIGASNAMLALENAKAMKDLRNDINRKVNAETANMDKSIAASVNQIDAIKHLEHTVGLAQIPEQLAAIAGMRLAHPDVNLRALGELMNPPIGKSGVNHRMKKLMELAKRHGWSGN